MSEWQINSFLMALHNIAKGIGTLATFAGVFVILGPIFWSFKK
jgi:hypothetical protein